MVAQPISVYADGGVGKTALAVELGWRLFEAPQFDFVLFLNASTPETLDAELASLCASDALDLPEQTAKEQEIRRAGAMRYLSTVEKGRLIGEINLLDGGFDNVIHFARESTLARSWRSFRRKTERRSARS